ncbi:hypothetical protein [Thermospira aquatica]|uniref:Uncharacterized protein n=1 Tax=Thermospira aquatica TaxID=2828656 RepID=A0AAX3BAC5_9SPIR|nr:hypothetical protein [Thermospira aquatica]URA09209.1 hypothetical protein KDW03_06795 [Thermospira aquatica]
MNDSIFETRLSFWFWAIFYDFLALLLFWLPKDLRKKLLLPLKKVFEEAIIGAYLTDGNDIGFFESFILGTDKTKDMVEEVYKIFSVHQKANLKEKLCGPLPDERVHSESQDILCGFVQDKKRLVVDILRNRNQIILYLHRRLAVRRPLLHALFWFGYLLLGR